MVLAAFAEPKRVGPAVAAVVLAACAPNSEPLAVPNVCDGWLLAVLVCGVPKDRVGAALVAPNTGLLAFVLAPNDKLLPVVLAVELNAGGFAPEPKAG